MSTEKPSKTLLESKRNIAWQILKDHQATIIKIAITGPDSPADGFAIQACVQFVAAELLADMQAVIELERANEQKGI